MDAMHYHRREPAATESGRGRFSSSGGGGTRGSGRDHRRRRDNDDGGRWSGSRDDSSSRASSSRAPSLSTSRWVPPKGRAAPAAAAPEPYSFGQSAIARERERENNCRVGGGGAGGQGGGGKVKRQRRHGSSDAQSQRNQHRQQHHRQQNGQRLEEKQHQQPPKKNIITPDHNTTSQQQNNDPPKAESEDLPKLDPNDPVQAKRMRQRRRQVLFGKNTAGYEEYCKKVPRHKRRPRSQECPMTPDHTLDVPTKRWQGLMNAWRRALHRYDPPDLHLRQPAQDTITLAPRPCDTEEDRQREEIAQAKAAGLQVAFGSMNVGAEARMFSFNVACDDDGGDLFAADASGNDGAEAFDEEAAYQRMMEGGGGDDIGLGEDESDSDDDLL